MYCQHLQVKITKPCEAKSCSFNIDRKEFNNCIMQYSTNDSNTLSLAEISYFYGKPYSEVKQVYTTAIQKIFSNVIKNELDNEVPTFYMKNTLCVESESYVDNPISLANDYVIDREELKYPKVVWDKAIEFSTTPERLMEILYDTFSLSIIDKFLNLPSGSARELKKLIGDSNGNR